MLQSYTKLNRIASARNGSTTAKAGNFVGDTGLFHDPQTGPWYPIISRKSAARFPVFFIAPSLEQVQLGA
jgi:hypothetical protein